MDYYNQILDKTVEKHIPFKVFLELTYNCNLSCKHCYIHSRPERKELSQQEIEDIIGQIYQMGGLFATFSGGEVLMRKDFFEIAAYARHKGLAIRIFTNGTLINPEITQQISSLRPLSVEISLYAMNPSIHDGITQIPGSFDKTISAIKMLKENGIEVVIKSPLMEDNFLEFYQLKKFANRIDARFIFDLNIIPREDGDKTPLARRLTDCHLGEFFSSVTPDKYWNKREIQDNEPVCNAGLNSLCISPYADVFPCVGVRLNMGNLREKKLTEIWDSDEFKQFRLSNKFSNLSECRQCGLLAYCRRCPGVARLEDGDFFGKSTAACRITKLQHSCLKKEVEVGL